MLGLAVSALLLAMSLLYGVRLTQLNGQAVETKAAVEELRRDNARLLARCACSVNLEEIERYAREELGMQPISAEQIRTVNRAG